MHIKFKMSSLRKRTLFHCIILLVSIDTLINAKIISSTLERSIDYDKLLSKMISKDNGSSSKELRSGNTRSGRFFGLTSGAYGNGLQLGLSFIVPVLNIPFGTNYYGGTTASSFYGTNYGTTPSYGSLTNSGTYNQISFNTWSIIFAVVIGIGAIIIVPGIIYALSGYNYSPFGRSDDVQGMVDNVMARVNAALLEYDIDAPSCLQRAVCSQVKSARMRMADGTAGSLERIIEGLATNTYVNSLLDGTGIQQAMSTARKSGASCKSFVTKCPYNMDGFQQSLMRYAQFYEANRNDDEEEYVNEVVSNS